MEVGAGLFQVDLAKRIGVSEMTIVNWEKGKTKPTRGIGKDYRQSKRFEGLKLFRRFLLTF